MLKRHWIGLGVLVALSGASRLAAQAPANATAKCKDGTYTTTTSHRGACKGHDGVAEWLTKTKPMGGAAAPVVGATALTEETPPNSTARCKDGSYWTNPSHRGACKGHKGVSEWLTEKKIEAKNAKAHHGRVATVGAAPIPGPNDAAHQMAPNAVAAGATAHATVLCNDGSYSHVQHHRGACAEHRGVKQWLKDVPE